MSTVTETNEAAERLRTYINAQGMVRAIATYRHAAISDLDAALAAERRATVERIREWAAEARSTPKGFDRTPAEAWSRLMARLDEEAAR